MMILNGKSVTFGTLKCIWITTIRSIGTVESLLLHRNKASFILRGYPYEGIICIEKKNQLDATE